MAAAVTFEHPGQRISTDELLRLPIYERLLAAFPYEGGQKGIDNNIIQTSKSLQDTSTLIHSWRANVDHGYNYTMYDDQKAYRLLLRNFGEAFPEIIEAYNTFPRVILRVDFFRYASLFLLGGTYSDTDTLCVKPLKDWISFNDTVYGTENTLGAIVGIESECDCEKWQDVYTRRVQFTQWTLQARRHHPMYAMLLANIVDLMNNFFETESKVLAIDGQRFDFSPGSEDYYKGIMELTGPGMFTSTVFQYLNSNPIFSSINPNDQETTFANLRHPDPKDTRQSNRIPDWSKFGWENVTMIQDPVLVNDVLILPEKFFNGKAKTDAQCLVEHRFRGSWKSSNNGVTDP